MRRRLLVVLAVIAALVIGVIAALVIRRLQGEGNIRGSSTEEFTISTTTVHAPPLGVPWPQYGFDPTRDRSVQLSLRPPYRRVWRYSAGSLVEFPPAIGYGRLYFSTNSGKFVAVNAKTGKRAWKYLSGRCVAASPAVGPYKHGTVYAVWEGATRLSTSDGTWFAKSTDGGETWSKPTLVANLVDIDELADTAFRVNSFPAGAITPDGRLYAA